MPMYKAMLDRVKYSIWGNINFKIKETKGIDIPAQATI